MLNKFFVYGTLRPGEVRWPVLSSVIAGALPESATLPGAWLYTVGPYPFITPGDMSVVHGEVVTVPPEQLDRVIAQLDAIEGYSARADAGLFVRRAVVVDLADGTKTQAWVYFGGADLTKEAADGEYQRIESGDWKQR